MADERYEWLDEDAAERLLGGAAGAGLGSGGVPEAERLTAALDALRADAGSFPGADTSSGAASVTGSGTGELPGEAAALAAYRKSAASTVRVRRRAPWGRPLRLGLVTALAAGALGGVAVAAGSGVLPAPFLFGGSEPEPAVSVSAAASPGGQEIGEDDPDARADADPERTEQPAPTSGGGTPDAPDTDPSVGTGTTGDTREPGSGPGSAHGSGDSSDTSAPAGTTGTDGTSGTDGSGTDTSQAGGNKGKTSPEEWRRRTVKACQDYRADRLPHHLKKYLETQAKGADNVTRFCDRLLDGQGGAPAPGASQGGGGESDDGQGGGAPGNGSAPGGANGGDGGSEDGSGGKNDGRSGSNVLAPPRSATDTRTPVGRALWTAPPAAFAPAGEPAYA
ncbi:hypothetical protein [Streptomyces sp. NPDC051561]|uniref:hypothetical protein n=1 Tax=Streptomyces sp. NPDC051561 TaxID=3365658 RepID=UPI0037B93489